MNLKFKLFSPIVSTPPPGYNFPVNIVAFAFQKNISSEVLQKLNIKDKYFIKSRNKDMQDLVNEIVKKHPDYILGLGKYGKASEDKLRIETHYSENNIEFPINYFLTPSTHTKLANGIGNSYCNMVSTLIMQAIKSKQLNSKFTFIHVPKTFDIDTATEEIEKMVTEIKQ